MFILSRVPWFSLPTSFQHDIVYFVHHTIGNGLEELSYASTHAVIGKHVLEIPKRTKERNKVDRKKTGYLSKLSPHGKQQSFCLGEPRHHVG